MKKTVKKPGTDYINTDELKPFEFKKEDWQYSEKCNFMYKGVSFHFFWNYYNYWYDISFDGEIDGRKVSGFFNVIGLEPTQVGTKAFCNSFKNAFDKYMKKEYYE